MLNSMRTVLILAEALINEARETLGFTSNSETVIYALREVVRRGRREHLNALLGRVTFDFDPAEIRKKDRRRRTMPPGAQHNRPAAHPG
jgi:Arc/MetJ family transcription regulator